MDQETRDESQHPVEDVRRSAFLAELSHALSASLEEHETLSVLARRIVQELADYCFIDVFDETGEIRRAVALHRRPELQDVLDEMQRRYPSQLRARVGMGQVLRTGQSILIPEVTPEVLRSGAQDEDHYLLGLRLSPSSAILVPMMSRGRVLGAICLAVSGDGGNGRRYGPADLALAEEIGSRAALALDNARLYHAIQEALRHRDESVEALRGTNRTLQALVQSCPLAVMVLDPDSTVRLWNPAAERIFGWTEAEALGKPLPVVPEDRREELQRNLDATLHGSLPQGLETVYQRKGGEPMLVNLWTSTVPNEQGGDRILGLVADVTERRRLDEELRRRVEELAAEDRRKDEFLAMLAHELRNPLAAISNAGHVLDQGGSADARTRDLVGVIGRQIRHLSRLVDDLLDVSRFTRGKIELRKVPVELRPIVEGAVETVQPLLERQGHRLTISMPEEPVVLEADATRIEQVLANLLNNAAKFTEPGGSLGLSVEARDGEAVLTVRDNGQGIAPDLLPRIFDLFVQEDRSLARSHGGLGIGLTLVRSLVERHGGRVEARSEGPGRGSEFVVRLPVLATEARIAEPARTAEAPAQPGPARVLLVEDNLDAADALVELLRMWGHEVEVVHDGASAVAKAGEARPDVVLLDIGLPGMDGYQVAGALRALPDLQDALLVALTGYGQEADRRRSAAAGFDHHLVKPVDLAELKRLVATGRNIGRGDGMLLRGMKSHHQASVLQKNGGNPGPAPKTKERDDELVRR